MSKHKHLHNKKSPAANGPRDEGISPAQRAANWLAFIEEHRRYDAQVRPPGTLKDDLGHAEAVLAGVLGDAEYLSREVREAEITLILDLNDTIAMCIYLAACVPFVGCDPGLESRANALIEARHQGKVMRPEVLVLDAAAAAEIYERYLAPVTGAPTPRFPEAEPGTPNPRRIITVAGSHVVFSVLGGRYSPD